MKLIHSITVVLLMIGYVNGQSSISKSLGMYVFPANDQNKDQQDQDEFKCYQWAVGQSGYDPINPTKVTPQEVETGPDGTAVRGAAKGAAMGAAIGAIAGDAGKGAAIGAASGGMLGVGRKRANAAGQQQQAAAAAKQKEAEMVNGFKRAFSVCLEGKGYTVK